MHSLRMWIFARERTLLQIFLTCVIGIEDIYTRRRIRPARFLKTIVSCLIKCPNDWVDVAICDSPQCAERLLVL